MQVMPEAAADGFEDRQGVRGGPAAQWDAPPLGDTVGHLGVDACGVDVDAVALGRCQQIHREGFGCQLGIHIQEIRRGAEVAHIVVAAAAGNAAHRDIGVVGRALQHFVHRAVAACRVDMYFFPAGCGGLGQLAGVAAAAGDLDLHVHPGAGSGRLDLGHQHHAGVGLAGRGIDDKQLLHGAPLSPYAS